MDGRHAMSWFALRSCIYPSANCWGAAEPAQRELMRGDVDLVGCIRSCWLSKLSKFVGPWLCSLKCGAHNIYIYIYLSTNIFRESRFTISHCRAWLSRKTGKQAPLKHVQYTTQLDSIVFNVLCINVHRRELWVASHCLSSRPTTTRWRYKYASKHAKINKLRWAHNLSLEGGQVYTCLCGKHVFQPDHHHVVI